MNLREAAQQALEALEWHLKRGAWGADIEGVTEALRAALAEPEQDMARQKPVAWTDGRGFIASHADSFPRGTTVSPLYTHHPTPRKPLTDEEIRRIYETHRASVPLYHAIARAIEAHHGINQETK